MEDLVKKLQEEVGLTEKQANESIDIIKEFLKKNGAEIDWEKFLKSKIGEIKDKAGHFYTNASEKTQTYTDKLVDTVDDLTAKARKGAHDLTQKAADFFDDKDDK